MLVAHMAEGRSFESFSAVIYKHTKGAVRAPRRSLYDWVHKHEEFRQAKELGEALSFEWWENLGRDNMTEKFFNTSVYIFNLKNRFGWRDKVELSGDQNAPIKVEAKVDIQKATDDELRGLIRSGSNGPTEQS